jgi:hypothetical protein
LRLIPLRGQSSPAPPGHRGRSRTRQRRPHLLRRERLAENGNIPESLASIAGVDRLIRSTRLPPPGQPTRPYRRQGRDAFNAPYLQHQLARIYLLVGEPEKALGQVEPLIRIPADLGTCPGPRARRRLADGAQDHAYPVDRAPLSLRSGCDGRAETPSTRTRNLLPLPHWLCEAGRTGSREANGSRSRGRLTLSDERSVALSKPRRVPDMQRCRHERDASPDGRIQGRRSAEEGAKVARERAGEDGVQSRHDAGRRRQAVDQVDESLGRPRTQRSLVSVRLVTGHEERPPLRHDLAGRRGVAGSFPQPSERPRS